MIVNVYSVYDLKARCYATPFFVLNDEVAKRVLSDVVNDKGTSVGRHPGDFALHKIGVFDDNLGKIESIVPEPLCQCAMLIVSGIENNIHKQMELSLVENGDK